MAAGLGIGLSCRKATADHGPDGGDLGKLTDPGEGHDGEHEDGRGGDGDTAGDEGSGGERWREAPAKGRGGGGEQHRHRNGDHNGNDHRVLSPLPVSSVRRSRSTSRRSSSSDRVPTNRDNTAARSSRASEQSLHLPGC